MAKPQKTRAEDLKTRENALKTALDLARKAWAGADFQVQCSRAGAKVIPGQEAALAELVLLGQTYRITHPEGRVYLADDEADADVSLHILILHYLAGAPDHPKSGKLIAYQEVPDGRLYYPNFIKRTTGILKSVFGDDVERLYLAALEAGGRPFDSGDLGLEFQAFPCISYVLVIWRGDEEFPPEMNIIFDQSVADYLPAEDIIVLAGMITIKIVKASGK